MIKPAGISKVLPILTISALVGGSRSGALLPRTSEWTAEPQT
jgi:hypothetical protein